MDPGRQSRGARTAGPDRPPRSSPVVGIVLLLLALASARAGTAALTAFAAVVSGLGALELAGSLRRQGAAVKPLAAAAGAAAFPVGAHLRGELGILLVAALAFLAFSSALAVRGLRPGTVRTLAGLMFPALYVGLGGASLVLAGRSGGTATVEVFLGMMAAYRLGLWIGGRLDGSTPAAPGILGVGVGSVACIAASGFLGLLLDHHPSVAPMLGIGLVVSLAATVGTNGAVLLSGQVKPGTKTAPRPVLGQLEPALLAAAAFFFAFQLLLT